MSGRYFVILGAMRTGSNLLEQIIAGLPGTVCHGEAFNPAFVGGPRREDILGWTRSARDRDPLGLLHAMREDAGDAMPGFRLFDKHAPDVLDHVLADPDCIRIVLRRDPLQSFVSLKIAVETDQWVLRAARRRRMTRIEFDAQAFASYRDGLAAHYDRIRDGMESAGTSALYLDYDQLQDPDLPYRLAGHLGLSASGGEPPALVRQNPISLRSKVRNYAQMCADLGMTPERLAPEPLPGPDCLELAQSVPVAVAPVSGPGLLPLQTLVHRLDCRVSGAPMLGRGPLTSAALEGTLFQQDSADGRATFAVISTPARRLKWLMSKVLLTGPDSLARLLIRERHADLPGTPNAWTAMLSEQRDAIFSDFLDLVARALAGDADLSCPANWRPQADQLAALTASGPAPRLYREADFGQMASDVCSAAGQAPFPAGQLTSISGIVLPMPDTEAMPDELVARANAIHARDLQEFGDLLHAE